MNDPASPSDEAATPLTPEERGQLIPTYITTRAQLNEAEQRNIAEADFWAFTRKRDVLNEGFLIALHKRMFKSVWKWAGSYRVTERNIGVEAFRINVELRALCQDARFWVENKSFSEDEIAVRFHHKLVFIHPFPNGNGRHARLAADLLAKRQGKPRFSWGRDNLIEPAATRAAYISALKIADRHDIAPLLAFARS